MQLQLLGSYMRDLGCTQVVRSWLAPPGVIIPEFLSLAPISSCWFRSLALSLSLFLSLSLTLSFAYVPTTKRLRLRSISSSCCPALLRPSCWYSLEFAIYRLVCVSMCVYVTVRTRRRYPQPDACVSSSSSISFENTHASCSVLRNGNSSSFLVVKPWHSQAVQHCSHNELSIHLRHEEVDWDPFWLPTTISRISDNRWQPLET